MSAKQSTLLAAALLVNSAYVAEAANYRFDVLDPAHYPQLSDSWLWDINEQGDATGYIHSASNGNFQPIIYRDGAFEILPVPLGSNSATPFEIYQNLGVDINSTRQVLGQYIDAAPLIPGTGQSIGLLTGAGPVKFPLPSTQQIVPAPTTVYNYPFPAVPAEFNRASLTHETGKLASLNNLGHAIFEGSYDNGNSSGISFYDGVGSRRLDFLNPAFPASASLLSYPLKLTGLTDSERFGVTVDEFNQDTFDEVLRHYVVDVAAGAFAALEIPVGADDIAINGIDDAGRVFGYSFDGLWFEQRVPVNLLLWNTDGSIAETIAPPIGVIRPNSFHRNNLGQIVGATEAGAVLYSAGTWTAVQGLGLDPQYDGLSVLSYNDAGQFVGLARDASRNFLFAYVASPAPEPTANALAFASVALVLLRGAWNAFSRREMPLAKP